MTILIMREIQVVECLENLRFSFTIPKILCYVGPCHHGRACPRVADGGAGLQTWSIAANILHKQSQTADEEWSSSLGVGRGANNALQ